MADLSVDNNLMLGPELQRSYQLAAKAEKKALEPLEKRKEEISKRSKLLGDLLSKVDAAKKILPQFTSPLAIREVAFKSSDEHVITGSAEKGVAEPGTHNIEVLQLASRSTAKSNLFPDKDETRVGSGYFSFTDSQGETHDVFIDNSNGTLSDLASHINQSRIGLKAAVVPDNSDPDEPGYRLMLAADGFGAGKAVTYPEFYFIDGEEDFFVEFENPAANARLRYEGLEIETSTNEVKDLIQGVTLKLNSTTDPGRPVAVTIEQDVPKITERVKDLVEKTNQILGFIQSQNKMDENTNTRENLGGEYSIRMAENRIRDVLQQNLLGEEGKKIRSLADIGIQFNKHGTLEFDEKRCDNALKANFDEAVELLAGDGRNRGIAPALQKVLNNLTAPESGLLANQRKTFDHQAKKIAGELESREKTAKTKLDHLKGKLAKLQGALSGIQAQSSAFMQSQAQAPTFGK